MSDAATLTVLTLKICGLAITLTGSVSLLRIKDCCAFGASRPPQGLLKPLVLHWCFLFSAITCILLANFCANADFAGLRLIIATLKCFIFLLTFITMAKDYCLKVKFL